MRLVRGLRLTTANLADVVSGLPTSGLKTKISGAPAASASGREPLSSNSSQAPSPAPPMNRRSKPGASGTRSALPSETSIRR